MKNYHITINGEIFDVTVQEVHPGSGGTLPMPAPTPRPAVPVPVAPTPAPVAPVPKPATPVAAPAAGGTQIQAPMPGKVLAVKVAEGDSVTAGTVLAILEAMKMENDIVAPADGTIQSIAANVGDSVNTGDVLIVMG